jgi:predicted outer membrane repeat protein
MICSIGLLHDKTTGCVALMTSKLQRKCGFMIFLFVFTLTLTTATLIDDLIQQNPIRLVDALQLTHDPIENFNGPHLERVKVEVVKRLSALACVLNESELRAAVTGAPTGLKILTDIDLCSNKITLTSEINVDNQYINFQCNQSDKTKKCVIDGQSLTRHFNISNSITSFEGIIFTNGNATSKGLWLTDDGEHSYAQGGSLLMFNSLVDVIECDFTKNVAELGKGQFGGAIFSYLSNLNMTRCNMMYNTAASKRNDTFSYGGAIMNYMSVVTLNGGENALDSTVFESNAAKDGGAILTSSARLTVDKGYFIFRNNEAVRFFFINRNFVTLVIRSRGVFAFVLLCDIKFIAKDKRSRGRGS